VNVGGLPALSATGQTYTSVRDQILKELRASWGAKDTHATVEPLSSADIEGRPNSHYTCP